MDVDAKIDTLFGDWGRELEGMYAKEGTPLEAGTGEGLARAMLVQLVGEGPSHDQLVRVLAKAHAQVPGSLVTDAFNEEVAKQFRELLGTEE